MAVVHRPSGRTSHRTGVGVGAVVSRVTGRRTKTLVHIWTKIISSMGRLNWVEGMGFVVEGYQPCLLSLIASPPVVLSEPPVQPDGRPIPVVGKLQRTPTRLRLPEG